MRLNWNRPFRNKSHRNKHNPELHKKKQTLLQDLDHGKGIHVENTNAGTVVFEDGLAVLPNDSRGNEMWAELDAKRRHPHQYAYVRDREGMMRDTTHPMRVVNPGMPWHKYDDLGRKV
jgi:hypothetical protein